jgi:hypothetical protein
MWADMIQIIKDWISSDVYKPSAAAYHSRWFCILKQDGKLLRLIHDLQPLNAVTICNSSTPPFVEYFAKSFAGYTVYGMMDLFAGYNQCPLHLESHNLTTFNSPMGPHCLTTVPMGYTNVVQIYQADMSFILQDKIPHFTYPFLDNLLVKTVVTQYQNKAGSYETSPDNSAIHCFIWEHLLVVHHILEQLQNVGITVSAKKFVLAAPDVTIVGHKCTFDSCILHEKKVHKVRDWPECQNLTHVHGFLGVCGVLQIFIKNFASIARPLVDLTRKAVPFEWGEPQQIAMRCLKDAICHSPALHHLHFTAWITNLDVKLPWLWIHP